MAFELNNVLTCRFEDYEYIGPASLTGTQIVNAELSNNMFAYKLYPTNYFGIRAQHDFMGNDYYEWQWYVPGFVLNGQYFIISYRVWPDPVVGGPDGNEGRQRFVVANSMGGTWRTLFLFDEYEPWNAFVEQEVFTPQSPAGAVGTATITDEDDVSSWISNPPQTGIRPIDYDPDWGWDEENRVWTPTARGGGRYRQQFIAIGKDGEIYYGDV